MKVFVKNGLIDRENTPEECLKHSETIKDIMQKIDNTVLELIDDALIFNFKIVALKSTIHLILQDKSSNYNGLEFLTNISFKGFKNYSFLMQADNTEEIICNIASDICNTILENLKGSVCRLVKIPIPDERCEEYENAIGFYNSLLSKNNIMLSGKGEPSGKVYVYMTVEENPSITYGNDDVRFETSNPVEFSGKYAPIFKCIYDGSYKQYMEKCTEICKKYNGRFILHGNTIIFKSEAFKTRNIPSAMELMKSGKDINQYIDSLTDDIDNFLEKRRLEEEERGKKRQEGIKSLMSSDIAFDIYKLVSKSEGCAVTSIPSFLRGTRTCTYIHTPELFGKWSHFTLKKIKKCIETMIDLDIFYTETKQGYSFEPFDIIFIKDEHVFDNIFGANEELEEFSNKLITEIDSLVERTINGTKALKEICSMIADNPSAKMKNLILKKLYDGKFNFGFLQNEMLIELQRYYEEQLKE